MPWEEQELPGTGAPGLGKAPVGPSPVGKGTLPLASAWPWPYRLTGKGRPWVSSRDPHSCVQHFLPDSCSSLCWVETELVLMGGCRGVGFPGSSDGKESACSAGDQGSIPGDGEDHLENGNPLQYSCLENPTD